MTAAAFDAFLESAWNDHADHPREVGARIAGSVGLIGSGEDVAPFVRLATHVYGEHLGEWRQGIALLESLHALPTCDGEAASAAVRRGIVTLRIGNGDPRALDGLDREDRAIALAGAAAAFAGRNDFARALDAYASALAAAEAGLAQGSAANRALAVGGNNLAAALEEKRDRDASETAGMVRAAEAALHHWRLAGKWLEEARAHYRLARSLIAAGGAQAAVASATQCLAVCAANDAPAFERFFGEAVLAIAHRAAGDNNAFAVARARARAAFGEIAEDERQWCASDLAELDA